MRLIGMVAMAIALSGNPMAHVYGADAYPSRPLRLIVPFPPAGATDMLARYVGEGLSARLGQNVVIDNRPGASGNIAARLAAQAPADGYTLLMAPSSIYAIAMSLYAEPGYDLLRDFAPVSTLANVPHVLVVHPTVPVTSVAQLVAMARARPAALTLASQGVGTVSHLEGELFQRMSGTRFLHIPYKGSAPAVIDLLSGRTQVMFDSVASTLPHLRAGKLKALAVTADRRASTLPNVPTMAEAGIAGYKADSWLGIVVPTGTPSALVQRLQQALNEIVDDQGMRSTLIERGFEPLSSTPAEFASRMREEITAWAKLIRVAKLRVE